MTEDAPAALPTRIALVPSLGRTNAYAAPWAPFLAQAPITAVSPLTETENPKRSDAAPSEALNSCCWLHTPPLRRNRYALFLLRAPIAAVSPLADTELPK